MSILKQVVSEALGSVFRRPSPEKSRSRIAESRSINDGANKDGRPEAYRPERLRTSQTGMNVVILNWKAGENDPFTVVNATIRQHLLACGKNVEVIEITEPNWTARVTELTAVGVEFVFTWQGLGSRATVGERGESLWDHLKIPLICIHGDHPSHMPLNHQLESRYCFHLYANAEFARYSNRHFRRRRSASVVDLPQLFREARVKQRE